MEQIYLNGRIVPATEATVRVSNPSLLQGVGLFETLRTYAGRPFRLAEHIERLQNSAAQFHLPIASVVPLIPEAVREVLDANELAEARVRITLTPPAADAETSDAVLIVTAQPVAGYAPELYEKGMTVLLCTDYRQSNQDPLAGHKTTSYLPRMIALRIAQERGCQEAIWFNPMNHLAEGSISNIFLVHERRLRAPPLDTPVLPGITRAAILEIADRDGIAVDDSPCTIDDLLDADEVFLTNAIMEVMPVTRIERRPIGGEKPGPLTRQLAVAYRELTERE